MRIIALACCGLAVATPALAATGHGEELPLEARVFFDRDALIPRLRALPPPARDGRAPAGRRGLGPKPVVDLDPPWGTRVGLLGPGEPAPLAWAPTPAVPPLLSQSPPKGARVDARLPVLEDRARLALERLLDRRAPDRAGGPHIFERGQRVSESGAPPRSRLPAHFMSTRWSDPLAAREPEPEAGAEFIMPFAHGRVTSLFNQGRRHPAIDLAGALGSPVLATTGAQQVVFAGPRGGYGNAVITRDAFGWTHLYGHLRSIASRVGQILEQGELLGHLGSTGHSTGPHVHYEVKDAKGAHVNPVGLLFPGRSVGKGLAWADVGQFKASPQLASRTVRADRVALAHAIERTPPVVAAKRKAKAPRYAYRVRAMEWDEGE